MAYSINEACTNCSACVLECPTGSIIQGREHYVIDADTCENHASCVAVCPVNAIHILKKAPNEQKAKKN